MNAKTKLFIAVLICLIIPAVLSATGTVSGTGITNRIRAIYSNSGATRYTNWATNDQTVQTVYGLNSTTISLQNAVAPGQTTSFTFIMTNKGNGSVQIALTNVFWNTNNTAQGGTWQYNFYTNSATNGGRFNQWTLAEDTYQTFYLVVTAPSAGNDGAALTNRFGSWITNTYSSSFSSLGSYTGMDGSVSFAGADFYTNNLAISVISAPDLQISKYAFVSNSPSYLALATAAADNAVVPGSMLVYAITWTNGGSGDLLGLTFRDAIDSSVQFVDNSMRFTNHTMWTASVVNYTNASKADHGLPSDYSYTNFEAGNYGITGGTNSGAVEVTFLSNIPGGARGTVLYKVLVK